MRDLERKLLYAAVLLLAVAVGYLTWIVATALSDCQHEHAEFKVQLEQLADDLASQHAAISQRVEGLYPHITSTCGTCRTCGTPPPDCPASSVVSNFTLLYENARLNDDEDITEDSVGVKLAERHERRLKKIATAFKACQRDTESTVKFGVTGYSSTAMFQREDLGGRVGMPESDKLNLRTANLRARVVADYLRKKEFEVEHEPWGSFANLRRPYLDNAPSGTDKEALNRTVFIEVLHAGACDLSQLPRPAR